MQKSTEEIHKARPTSPHLSIYKPQISSVLSIGHRLSGIGLFFMISALSWWFILWVFSRFDQTYLEIFNNGFIKFLLVLTSYGFFYHLCTGIRHLIWDTGHGFSIKAINYSGWLAVIASVVLTLIFWVLV
jgi:succinate dehydrogenase / fumarate reductase cytochrome b subunit